jgi:hypothetical protein
MRSNLSGDRSEGEKRGDASALYGAREAALVLGAHSRACAGCYFVLMREEFF